MPRTTVRVAFAVVALLALAACAPTPEQPTVTRTQVPLATTCGASGPIHPPAEVSSAGRPSWLYAPTGYVPGHAYPLLVSLHPFLTVPEAWEGYSGLVAAAQARGYWVLLPHGSDPGPRWAVPGGLDTGIDDVGWVEGLIQATASEVCVDSSRVFAAGFSAGAAMSVGMSCELPWRFRAIAASGGSNLTSLCPSAGPTDALILHGSADPIAPLTGSTTAFATPLGLSVDSVVANFALRNGCNPTPTVSTITASVTADHYTCAGHRLDYWRMTGAGHTWAGATIPLDIVTGPTDYSFSADTAVLDYFDAS